MPQRREFLQQSRTFYPTRHDVSGWYISEEIDGVRCLWDGGLSRYVATEKVPWASLKSPKTGEKKKVKPFSSGLWTQYGNPIIAPDQFLDRLPPFPCDAIFYGDFEIAQSICVSPIPHPRFNEVKMAVLSSPSFDALFQTGLVKNSNMDVLIDFQRCKRFVQKHAPDAETINKGATLEQELFMMRGWNGWDEQIHIAPCSILPSDITKAKAATAILAERILAKGGTGILLRNPHKSWTPKRVDHVLRFTIESE